MKAWEREPLASDYARFRPLYPDALFDFITLQAPGRELAWDCGTGNGQAAVGLSRHFARVLATDRSPSQIAHALANPRVAYRVAPAEQSGLPAGSADVVTVAQALHWFALDAFFAEASRVLRPGGMLAAWCYPIGHITPEIDVILAGFYYDVVRPYWDPRIGLVDDRYETISFPGANIEAPALRGSAAWTFDDLLGFIRTWSGREQFIAARGYDPLVDVMPQLRGAWGEPAQRRPVTWPIWLRATRLP